MDKKLPGRPRLYSTSSDKVDAFRQRQKSAGYVRKEILVTEEAWDRIRNLAKLHGVGVIDAAAGLLEQGLEDYEAKHVQRSPNPAGYLLAGATAQAASLNAMSATRALGSIAPVSAQSASPQEVISKAGSSDANPITRFFAKRKEQNND